MFLAEGFQWIQCLGTSIVREGGVPNSITLLFNLEMVNPLHILYGTKLTSRHCQF